MNTAWLMGPASTNLRLILFTLVDIIIILLVARAAAVVWRAFRAEGTKPTDWIAKAPTTNLRILVGIALAVLYVLVMLGGIVLARDMDSDNMMIVGGFVLVQMGIDMVQFGWKRSTFKPEALGMTRESAEPQPPTPAAQVVQQTGEPPVSSPSAAELQSVDKIPGSGD